jgi:hypothetical protein
VFLGLLPVVAQIPIRPIAFIVLLALLCLAGGGVLGAILTGIADGAKAPPNAAGPRNAID